MNRALIELSVSMAILIPRLAGHAHKLMGEVNANITQDRLH
jgi:hypothetical protein